MTKILLSIWSFLLVIFHLNSPPLTSPLSSIITPLPTVTPANLTLGLVGDLGLGRHITATSRIKNDFSWSFQGVDGWLRSNDLNLANLESPIIKNCPEGKTGTFTFCGDPRFLPILSQYNFVFNLNNNHILNYGQDGLTQTENFLPVDSYVYDNLLIKNIKGIKIGFLGYDFISYPNLDKSKILNQIKNAKPQVDWLIVTIHWGNEYLPKAEPWRVALAHQMIDTGADIIHGQHPHVWQPPEIYHGKPIYYSLGNFIFDQSWSYQTSHSNIVRLTLTKGKIINTDISPIVIKFNSQPWLTP